ncbi:MAG: hypothetical protein ABWX81_08210, partial [Pseudolabrys sp.]
ARQLKWYRLILIINTCTDQFRPLKQVPMLAAAPAVMIANVRFGSEADIFSAKGDVRFAARAVRK